MSYLVVVEGVRKDEANTYVSFDFALDATAWMGRVRQFVEVLDDVVKEGRWTGLHGPYPTASPDEAEKLIHDRWVEEAEWQADSK